LTDKDTTEEKNNAIKRIKQLLNQFEDTLKIAENLYEDAQRKGDLKIQKEIQKKMEMIKKEETSLKNIILGIEELCN
jgi:hypothetical protein